LLKLTRQLNRGRRQRILPRPATKTLVPKGKKTGG
jgi:hypothetical protein